jgi:guanylate kinase
MPERPGLLVVVSGPSGVGKTTITHELVRRLDAVFSVSMTTRPRKGTDREGVDYYFVDDARFKRAIAGGEFLEWAHVFDRYYGTPRKPVEENLAAGRDVILEIDVAGGKQVKAAMPGMLGIFILPPSEDDLVKRLRARGREDEPEIQRRFRDAQREIAEAKACGAYDRFVVNKDLNAAVQEAYDVVKRKKDR